MLNVVPRYLAARSMHRMVYRGVEPIVDRRQVPRETEVPPAARDESPHADGTDDEAGSNSEDDTSRG